MKKKKKKENPRVGWRADTCTFFVQRQISRGTPSPTAESQESSCSSGFFLFLTHLFGEEHHRIFYLKMRYNNHTCDLYLRSLQRLVSLFPCHNLGRAVYNNGVYDERLIFLVTSSSTIWSFISVEWAARLAVWNYVSSPSICPRVVMFSDICFTEVHSHVKPGGSNCRQKNISSLYRADRRRKLWSGQHERPSLICSELTSRLNYHVGFMSLKTFLIWFVFLW